MGEDEANEAVAEGESEFELVAVGLGLPEKVKVGLELGVRLRVLVGLGDVDRVARGDEELATERVSEGVADDVPETEADTDREGLPLLEGMPVTVPALDAEIKELRVTVTVVVGDAVAEGERDTSDEAEGLREPVALKLATGLAETEAVPVRLARVVCVGIELGEVLIVTEEVCDGEPLTVAEGEGEDDSLLEADEVSLGEPVVVPVASAERDTVADGAADLEARLENETKDEAVEEKVASGLRDSVAEAVLVTDAFDEGEVDAEAEELLVAEAELDADLEDDGEGAPDNVAELVRVAREDTVAVIDDEAEPDAGLDAAALAELEGEVTAVLLLVAEYVGSAVATADVEGMLEIVA